MERITHGLNVINTTGNQTLSGPNVNVANQIIFSLLLSIILIVAFLGNVFMLATLRKCQSLSIVSKFHVCNLASANLVKTCSIMPLNFYTIVLPDHPFNHISCEIISSTNMILTIAANMSLAAVAVDRYYATIRTIKYANIFTGRIGLISVIGIWILAALAACLPLIRLSNRSITGNNCFYEWSSNQFMSLMILLVVNSTAYIIPLIILVVCYFKIKANVVTARKQMRNTIKADASYSIPEQLELRSSHSDQQHQLRDEITTPPLQNSARSESYHSHSHSYFCPSFSLLPPLFRGHTRNTSIRLRADTSASDEVADQVRRSPTNHIILQENGQHINDITSHPIANKVDGQDHNGRRRGSISSIAYQDDTKASVQISSITIAVTELKEMSPISRERCVTGTSMISSATNNAKIVEDQNDGQQHQVENDSPNSKPPVIRYRYRTRAFRRSRILLERLASVRSRKQILVNVKVLGGNIICMIVCWTPFTIILIVSVIFNSMAIVPTWIKTVALLFTYTNAALSPIIHMPRVKHATSFSKLTNRLHGK